MRLCSMYGIVQAFELLSFKVQVVSVSPDGVQGDQLVQKHHDACMHAVSAVTCGASAQFAALARPVAVLAFAWLTLQKGKPVHVLFRAPGSFCLPATSGALHVKLFTSSAGSRGERGRAKRQCAS
jgi:hypothetical protein